MNKMILPSLSVTSFTTAFKRSSNSPRYFAPAINAPISNAKMILFFRFSGTSPFMIRCAIPSAIAVLPTPGSPTNSGLFLVLRERICSVLRISSSRPITGSSFPAAANSFKFFAYFCNELYCASAFCEDTVAPLRKSIMAAFRFFSFNPSSFSIFETVSLPATKPNNKCSTLTNSSLKSFRKEFDFSKTVFKSLDKACPPSVEVVGILLSKS